MFKTVMILLLIVSSGLSGCTAGGQPSVTATLSSGIEGYVTKGPMCPGPVQIGDTTCQDQPYQANIIILDTNKIKIIQFQPDNNGYFKIKLSPGTYILHPEPGQPFPISDDQTVVVIEGQFTQVTIHYDTGIR